MISLTIGKFALAVATLSWVVFVAWYALRSRWWRNRYARNLWFTGAAIATVLALTMTWALIGWRDWLVYLWTPVLLWLTWLGAERTYYMEQAQREPKIMSDAEVVERLILELVRATGQPEGAVRDRVRQMRETVLD